MYLYTKPNPNPVEYWQCTNSVVYPKSHVLHFNIKLQTGTYDLLIHPQHLSVLPTVMFHPRFRHNIQTTAAVFYLTSSGRSARSSLQSASGRFWFRVPPSGTTCLSTSHLRRHSRFSDNDSRPFYFPVPTKTLSYDSCVTITIHHYCLDTRGPCNN